MKSIFSLLLMLFIVFDADAQCWKSISLGSGHNIAIKNDGTLWAWGFNYNGQLGDGTKISSAIPIQIGKDSNWLMVSAGGNSSFAIKTDGTLWAWGQNDDYQLGDSSRDDKTIPILISASSDWRSISGGGSNTMAIKNDGTMWGWGYNHDGQLGDSLGLFKMVPTKIGIDTDWHLIATGGGYTMAIKDNGTLWGWGYSGGRIGDSIFTTLYKPTKVGSDTNWKDVKTGNLHTLALKKNGTIWACGFDSHGQVGVGLLHAQTLDFVKIGTDSDWKSIAIGQHHSFGTKTDGTLWAWGDNSMGQLGDTKISGAKYPIRVGLGSDWDYAYGALGINNRSYAIKKDSSLWGAGQFFIGDGSSDNKYDYVAINCFGVSHIRENEFVDTLFLIFPNPANNFLKIKNSSFQPIERVQIINTMGAVVLNKEQNIEAIPIFDLVQGMYWVRISYNNKVYSRLFMKY
jgi:alpha-tubulin suppressor-like RCC1 family protein